MSPWLRSLWGIPQDSPPVLVSSSQTEHILKISHHLCLGVECREEGEPGPYAPPISPSHLLGTQAALLGLQVVTKARAPVLRPIPQLRVSTQLLLCYKQGLQPGSITQGSGTDCEEGTQDHSEGIYCSRHVPQRPCSGHVQSSFSSSCSGFCKHYKTAIGL